MLVDTGRTGRAVRQRCGVRAPRTARDHPTRCARHPPNAESCRVSCVASDSRAVRSARPFLGEEENLLGAFFGETGPKPGVEAFSVFAFGAMLILTSSYISALVVGVAVSRASGCGFGARRRTKRDAWRDWRRSIPHSRRSETTFLPIAGARQQPPGDRVAPRNVRRTAAQAEHPILTSPRQRPKGRRRAQIGRSVRCTQTDQGAAGSPSNAQSTIPNQVITPLSTPKRKK